MESSFAASDSFTAPKALLFPYVYFVYIFRFLYVFFRILRRKM